MVAGQGIERVDDLLGSYSFRGRRWYEKQNICFGHLLGPTNISTRNNKGQITHSVLRLWKRLVVATLQ